MEPYSGNPFVTTEIVAASQRRTGVHFHAQAMGIEFNWTLNQKVLFSSALTGKPSRKESFNKYHWDRCVIGTQEDYVMATQHQEWVGALIHGNPWGLKNQCDDPANFAPANNTDYRNVSAYLEVSGATSGRRHVTPTPLDWKPEDAEAQWMKGIC